MEPWLYFTHLAAAAVGFGTCWYGSRRQVRRLLDQFDTEERPR